MRLSITLSNCILETSSYGGSTMLLGRLFLWMNILTVKISFLCWDENSPGATCTCNPLSSPCGSLQWEGLYALCSCPLNTWIPWKAHPSLFFFKDIRPNSFSLSSQGCSLAPSWWPSFGPSLACPHYSSNVGTRTGHDTPGAAWKALSRLGWLHVYPC